MNWFSKIHELAGQEYERYLPTAFDESLTLLEKVNKVIETLNQIVLGVNTVADYVDGHVDTQNEKIKQLRDDFEILKEWLENEGLEERTKQVLNEWFDNGRLAQIINNDVFDMKADKATFEQFVLSITTQLQQTTSRLNSEYINVKYPPSPHVGAVGDGVSDDGQIIQNLIDLDKPIFIPPGHYLSTQSLYLKKNNFIGSSARKTVFNFTNNNHGFVIESEVMTERDSVQIEGFKIMSTAPNRGNYYGIYAGGVAVGTSVKYNFGVNLSNIEIYNFGGGLYFSDFFRLNVDKIGMTGVIQAVSIVGSVVQSTFSRITSNSTPNLASTLTNVGLVVIAKTYAEGLLTPESVKNESLSFVKHDVGIHYKGGLAVTFNNIDLDYCLDKGIYTTYDATFENCYIASSNTSSKFRGIHCESGDQTKPYDKKFKNVLITTYGTIHADSVAIQYGDGGLAPYKEEWGGVFENITVSGSGWKHAINADRHKSVTIKGCRVANNACSGVAFVLSNSKYAIVEGNILQGGEIHVESPFNNGYGTIKYNDATVTQAFMTNPTGWDIGFNKPAS